MKTIKYADLTKRLATLQLGLKHTAVASTQEAIKDAIADTQTAINFYEAVDQDRKSRN